MTFPHFQVWIDLAGKREMALVLLTAMVILTLACMIGIKFNVPRYFPAARVLMIVFFFATFVINWLL